MDEGKSFLSLILEDEQLLNIIIAIGILLLAFLVLFIISSIRGKRSSYIGRGGYSKKANNRNNESDKYRRDQNLLGRGKEYYNQDTYINQLHNIQDDSPKYETASISLSNSEDDNSENQSPIRRTLNGDGTIRTEIDFDSPNDNPAPNYIFPKYEYLETANNGQFRKLLSSDEKSFFRTWDENGTRKFEFHGNVDKALANINAIFDDVCEIEGKQNGATQIDNDEPGILDSKLKVIKLAKIKLS